MKFDPPLVPATLVRRYKRFLVDVELDSGEMITGSCPNTGSMLGLTAPGSRCYLTEHAGGTRKFRHALELVEADGTLVGINTARPNRLVEEAIEAGMIGSLGLYAERRREQKYGLNSRIDILLSDPERGRAYVEVKNVHFCRTPRLAEFPDSVTLRGAKHLEELGDMVEAGHRAIMVYLIQRDDIDRLRICHDLDPGYAAAFRRAMKRGVEACAIRCKITSEELCAESLVPVEEPDVNSVS
ncbi:DNA/RNA nuclease SfsA [Hoeflea olei]|uniref:Sugar fermentation stimulation protein homolog n=1 Tax=Hoeflea olei TaxID=1480615 RepID=A0A1C1YZF2_9HYPH|nr:DNA/RNA nuclease SfsA [Hoeflea olei]OCW58913.1 XRE family transcriptional regulator [Hoeflea olei]